jgi:hypothetical protein
MGELGLQIFPREQQTPEALAAFHRAEIEKWWPIIKAASIRGTERRSVESARHSGSVHVDQSGERR